MTNKIYSVSVHDAVTMSMLTNHVMAPEQVTDAKNVDHRADIYSLGVTLYQFLSLDLPFTSENIYGLFHLILNEKPKALSEVAPNLLKSVYRLVDWMTHRDPEKRPQSMGDVFDAVDAILTCIELGTDNWYPRDDVPEIISPMTLQVNIEPPRPVKTPAAPQPQTAPTKPSASRSEARKRLTQMRLDGKEMVAKGDNPVEFLVPDILKQRDQIGRAHV